MRSGDSFPSSVPLRTGRDAGCGDDCTDPSGTSGQGRTDQEAGPGFEGRPEHSPQGGRSDETSAVYERKVQPRPKLGPWIAELDRRLEANEKKPRGSHLLTTGATSIQPPGGVNFARRSGVDIERRLTAKSGRENLRRDELATFRRLADEYLVLEASGLAAAQAVGAIIEVKCDDQAIQE